MIKIGLPKGGIKEKSMEVIKKITGIEMGNKKLNFKNDIYEFYLLKHRDIPKMINEGLLDAGITSYEWIKESETDLKVLKELDWCNTSIALIGKEMKNGKAKCATEFFNVTNKYISERKLDIEVYKLSGSGEACIPGLFDYCVDCVETGETLKQNGLVVLDEILTSKVMLVCKDESVVEKDGFSKLLEVL